MATLIISEKHALTRILLPFLPEDLANSDTFVAHTMTTGLARAKFSRGRPLREYPLIEEPRYSADLSPTFYATPIQAYANSSAYGAAKAVPVPELLPAVTRVIYACDPDPTGIWAFRSALTLWAGPAAGKADYEAWLLLGLDAVSIRHAIAAGTTTAALASASAYAETKRYFEFQYSNNAHVVLGAAMRVAGIASSRIISKFALQVLYDLRNAPQLSDAVVIKRMSAWPGTGRYAAGRLGSEASRYEILKQLCDLGLVSLNDKVEITRLGHTFLEHLHPDCMDLDLPQRLDAWGAQGLAAAKPSMDRYIRSFFGKQLRFAAVRVP